MRKIALVLLLAAAGTFVASGGAHAASGDPNQDQPHKHVVVSGESLSLIATENNLPSWLPLWDVNPNIQNPDQIYVGEELTIPTPPYPTTNRPLPAGYGAPAPAPVVSTSAAPVTQSAPAPAPVTSYQPASPLSGGLAALAHRVCMRESGCNYAENTGNGYYGAYQFDIGTWGNFDGYATANLAPPAVQDQKFQATYAVRGCEPWPNTCY